MTSGNALSDKRIELWNSIKQELKDATADWGDDFQFKLEDESDNYDDENIVYVSVTMKHRYFDEVYFFNCRREADEEYPEIEFSEDSFHTLDKENLFAYLFFEASMKLKERK